MVKIENCKFSCTNLYFRAPAGFSAEIGFNERGNFLVIVDYAEGGSYFTQIPISPIEYRATHKTKCGFKKISRNTVVIFDDWGTPHSFLIGKATLIKELIDNCIANGLEERE